jgi:hypothetical protein
VVNPLPRGLGNLYNLGMSAAHEAVKHEMLVRYLDAWTPTVLHRNKRATYVEAVPAGAEAGATALRVFGEFSDLLERHALTMMLVGPPQAPETTPPGLVVQTVADPDALGSALRQAGAVGSPLFVWADHPDSLDDLLSTVSAYPGCEILLAVPGGADPDTGQALTVRVDLVDRSQVAERLVFGTGSLKALEKFKDELWALDEYAGIRYRDPVDAEGTLLDISLQPNLAPLRRSLIGHLARAGAVSVASLREWTLRETIYRAADATRAVQGLVGSGIAVRTPASGRLSPDTLVSRSAA